MTLDTLMPEASEEVDFECDLEAPPEKVWRALTVPAFIAAWLMPNTLTKTEPGERFAFDGKRLGLPEKIDCEVLTAEPERLLRYRWRESDDADSFVTFQLSPRGKGTRLRIIHTAPSRFAATMMMLAANANAPPLRLAA
jgi:uncharacterized protein YndB with AHSA1/START domain